MKRLLFVAMLALAGCDKHAPVANCPVCPPVSAPCVDKPCPQHAPVCKSGCDKCKCCCDR